LNIALLIPSGPETSGWSSKVVTAVRPLDTREIDLWQSLVMCPVRPQTIQSLCSTVMSLPSFPSLVIRSGLAPEESDILAAVPLDSLDSFGTAAEEDMEAEVDIVGLLKVYLNVDRLVEGFVC
jgi:hypothetical protein